MPGHDDPRGRRPEDHGLTSMAIMIYDFELLPVYEVLEFDIFSSTDLIVIQPISNVFTLCEFETFMDGMLRLNSFLVALWSETWAAVGRLAHVQEDRRRQPARGQLSGADWVTVVAAKVNGAVPIGICGAIGASKDRNCYAS